MILYGIFICFHTFSPLFFLNHNGASFGKSLQSKRERRRLEDKESEKKLMLFYFLDFVFRFVTQPIRVSNETEQKGIEGNALWTGKVGEKKRPK